MSQISMPRSTALHMSYTVSSAMETPVRASISMPVLPVTPVVMTAWMPTRPSSRSPALTGSSSHLDLVMLSGWHIGIRLLVCLQPMIPATRAQARTSPFAAVPSTIMSRVSWCMKIHPSAIAWRFVSSFSDTSTMRTAPFSSTWLSVPGRASGCSEIPAERPPGSVSDIVLYPPIWLMRRTVPRSS